MNERVKIMNFTPWMKSATTFLCVLTVLTLDYRVEADRSCVDSLQRTLRLTRLVQKESADLIKTYKASQGEMSELFCRASVPDVPDASVSGLSPVERLGSVSVHLVLFVSHFKRVYDQQTDLQPPASPLLAQLARVSARSRHLAALVHDYYRKVFPNVPVPEPAGGGATAPPPPQNVFQQKVYGCRVLKTYKDFLGNVTRELRTQKSKVCRTIGGNVV